MQIGCYALIKKWKRVGEGAMLLLVQELIKALWLLIIATDIYVHPFSHYIQPSSAKISCQIAVANYGAK